MCNKKGKMVLSLGGARSGKSSFAEKIASMLGEHITYIATASIKDAEMADRVHKHRQRRPSNWFTKEEEIKVVEILGQGQPGNVFLIDCATLWLSNIILCDYLPWPGASTEDKRVYILEQVKLLSGFVDKGINLIVVSNEVGLGLVPEYPLGRVYRDIAGEVNQLLAANSDHVFFSIAGLTVDIKSMHTCYS